MSFRASHVAGSGGFLGPKPGGASGADKDGTKNVATYSGHGFYVVLGKSCHEHFSISWFMGT